MASDPVIHGLFRSLESCIHERLSMIEEACTGRPVQRVEPSGNDEILNCIQTLESRLTAIESSIQDIKTKSMSSETVHVNCIGKEPATPQLWIKAMKDLEIVLPPCGAQTTPAGDEVEVVEDKEVEEVDEEEEVEEEVEEVDEEEEVEEEEGIEAEPFTFKNKTYYKDPENNVYGIDEDENLLPDPIGVWDTVRQRVLFKRIV